MYYFFTVLIIICCLLLIIIVLLQNSKGGGLVSGMASSSQVMGVRRTADFLEKATWYMAIALLSLSLLSTMAIDRSEDDPNRSAIEEQLKRAENPAAMPSFPTQAPVEE